MSKTIIKGNYKYRNNVEIKNLVVDSLNTTVLSSPINTNTNAVSINNGTVTKVYHLLDGTVNNLMFSFTLTPSVKNSYQTIQATLPNRTQQNINIQDIIGTISVFDSNNRICMNNNIYSDTTSNKLIIRFLSQSTSIHYITINVKYFSN